MRSWNENDFDNYLLNRMVDAERVDFETALASDDRLKETFSSYRHTIALLQQDYKRQSLKRQLKRIHQELYPELLKERKQSYRSVFSLRSLSQIAAAAAVAALVTFSLFYLTDHLDFHNKDAYVDLRNELQEISIEQKSIKNELVKQIEKPVIFTGTCFPITTDGILVTNNHVIKDLDSVWVSNHTNTTVKYLTAIVYRNKVRDIALLKITDPAFKGFNRLPYAMPGHKKVEMGEYIFTLGYSKQDIVFGEGSISSLTGHQCDTTAYQVSIPVNPGNSGGPVFDASGNLLGMISGKNTRKEGVGFALKSHFILEALEEYTALHPAPPPVISNVTRFQSNKRTDQIKTLQPLIFRVQTTR